MYASYVHLAFWLTPVLGWMFSWFDLNILMSTVAGFISWIWIGEVAATGAIAIVLLELAIFFYSDNNLWSKQAIREI